VRRTRTNNIRRYNLMKEDMARVKSRKTDVDPALELTAAKVGRQAME